MEPSNTPASSSAVQTIFWWWPWVKRRARHCFRGGFTCKVMKYHKLLQLLLRDFQMFQPSFGKVNLLQLLQLLLAFPVILASTSDCQPSNGDMAKKGCAKVKLEVFSPRQKSFGFLFHWKFVQLRISKQLLWAWGIASWHALWVCGLGWISRLHQDLHKWKLHERLVSLLHPKK